MWGWAMYLAFQITQLGTTILLESEALIYKLTVFVSKLPKPSELDPETYGQYTVNAYKRVANKYRDVIYFCTIIRMWSYICDSVLVLWHTPFIKNGANITSIVSTGAWHLLDFWALLSIPAIVAGVEIMFQIIKQYTILGRIFAVSLDDLEKITTNTAPATNNAKIRLPKLAKAKKD
jgi:hypothetical protein